MMLQPTPKVRLAASAAVAFALLSGLGGCREERLDNLTAVTLSDPAKRHPIGYGRRTEALYVEVASDGLGLSDNQATDVHRFIDRYKSEANGRLAISAPSSVKGHFAVSRSVRDVEQLVERSGIPDQAVEHQRSRDTRYGPAVKLSYERSIALPPNCGSWPDDMGTVERERLPYENFGCANQRNLAMAVANARDLRVPQEETPRPSEVRSGSWSKYIGGGGGGGKAAGGAAEPASSTGSKPAQAK